MQQLDYDLLFRWFVWLGVDDPVWDVTVFTKNRDRLIAGEIAAKFFAAVLARPELAALMSDEHFSVAGTLIQAWAFMKSFRPKDGSGAPPGIRATCSASRSASGSRVERDRERSSRKLASRRLAEIGPRLPPDQVPRAGTGQHGVHHGPRRLQTDPRPVNGGFSQAELRGSRQLDEGHARSKFAPWHWLTSNRRSADNWHLA